MIYSMEETRKVVSHVPTTTPQMTNDSSWTTFSESYPVGEMVWGFILLFGIFGVNGSVLWVVGKSRELWKPRHLWMACLCVTDLFVGGHKCLELLLLIWPQRELCVLQRATLGIPYVVNMLLLTLLSLDRFVAVRYPFYYSSSISNRHVLIGFLLVLMAGSSLAGASVTLGLRDPICRAQSLQLVYLTIVLTICSILTLLFNSSVLRIAKRQLNAIYAHEPVVNARRVSLFCTNCGHKNATFVKTLVPPPLLESTPASSDVPDTSHLGSILPVTLPLTLPLTLPEPVVLSALDLESQFHQAHPPEETCLTLDGFTHESTPLTLSDHPLEDGMSPLIRTLSLPTLPESITLIVPPDPIIPPTAILLANSTADIMENTVKINSSSPQLNAPVSFPHTITVALPRSRSFTCAKKSPPEVTTPSRHHQLFRNLHFTRSHMFHVGRLFPSIRFARTVMLIMIPMWVFILPIVTIIPLHRGCADGGHSELNCDIVNKLWAYLLIHMRSVLPIQAILDTLIYACGSKEFRHCFQKLVRSNSHIK
ncbi:unnamed protein product [Allacma fusca]|uniref:G-protein coupled receptors family 1 profile domain-containing protein n=1 Tax=Allacma fusca TaxID=39272 RepID=A0A8J2KG84_9HEXA|nr:unnamed protein product [Allacma fusca]